MESFLWELTCPGKLFLGEAEGSLAIQTRRARAGCVTQAAMNGVREFVIMRQTGHKTVATLRRYIRSGEIFRENAAAGLGI